MTDVAESVAECMVKSATESVAESVAECMVMDVAEYVAECIIRVWLSAWLRVLPAPG